jgi:rhamnulokinase
VAVGSHDTASAVAAVPAGKAPFAYLSSGTWSLMGVETAKPVINAQTLGFNLTNEGGVCHTIRLLKNIMGLWLVQQCRATWKAQGEDLSYEEITRLARAAPSCAAFVDPFDSLFFSPGDMPARIRQYCIRTRQKPPKDKGAIVRTALESLALAYRRVHDQLVEVTGRPPAALHIVGGGSQNALLNQLVANATGRTVVAGPAEATAAGNILTQALGAGVLRSLEELREVVRQSFEVTTYAPKPDPRWDRAFERFEKLVTSSGSAT